MNDTIILHKDERQYSMTPKQVFLARDTTFTLGTIFNVLKTNLIVYAYAPFFTSSLPVDGCVIYFIFNKKIY